MKSWYAIIMSLLYSWNTLHASLQLANTRELSLCASWKLKNVLQE